MLIPVFIGVDAFFYKIIKNKSNKCLYNSVVVVSLTQQTNKQTKI